MPGLVLPSGRVPPPASVAEDPKLRAFGYVHGDCEPSDIEGFYVVVREINSAVVDFEILDFGACEDETGKSIRGSVKFDGCMNWTTSNECAEHTCGPENVAETTAKLNAAFACAHAALKGLGACVMFEPPAVEHLVVASCTGTGSVVL